LASDASSGGIGSAIRSTLCLALLLAAAALLAPAAGAVQVYHSDEEALALAFPDATRIEPRTVTLDEAGRARVAEQLGYGVRDRMVVLREAWRGDTLLGRALVLEELGKSLPFRFLVAITPDGKVDQVLLLNYREPRGYEIERDAFRVQYQGKALADPIRRGQDIRNVTGATISVDSLSRGVRRALALSEAATGAAPTTASRGG
jgi:hypothetical protein